MPHEYTPSQRVEKFWERVDQSGGADSCWEWTGGKHKDGYGSIGIGNKKTMKTHRFSWIQSYGEIPDGLQVLHKCDNPACANPSHLFLGTQVENIQDMVRKGRLVNGLGERNSNHKLTEFEVAEIRRLRAEGVYLKDLAAQFGVTLSHISQIARGLSWRG